MKILLHSSAFPPQIGGLEEIARIVAQGATESGHEVTVWCETPDPASSSSQFPFKVMRQPTLLQAIRATWEADVFLMFNMSLKALPIPLLCRKPIVVSHQGWYSAGQNILDFRARLKRLLSKVLAANIACSRAVANYLQGQSVVIPNAYNDKVFKIRPEVLQTRDILFVGRLVSDKGANLLVEALGKLIRHGLRPTLTITGNGPEEKALQKQVNDLGLDVQTVFTGPLSGEVLACTMNKHRILVIPSLWAEPFGIVALEGIASGCTVIGSEQGGLIDAIGICGMVFPNGDVEALVQRLSAALVGRGWKTPEKKDVLQHLGRHRSSVVAGGYVSVLQDAIFSKSL